MVKIKKNRLYITRSDSAYLSFGLTTGDGSAYLMQDGDSIHVQVRDKKTDGSIIFEGKVEQMPSGEYVWHIYPEDTKEMKVTDDSQDEDQWYYWYDVELRTGEDVFTFIPSSPFIVTDETTLKE